MDITALIDKYIVGEQKDSKYQIFFRGKLKEWKINSPADLSDEEKKKFFDEIDKEYKGKKE